MREDLKNATSETKNQLNTKSQSKAQDKVIDEDKPKIAKILKMKKGNCKEMCCWRTNTPTIYVETDDMVSGQLKVTDNEVHNIDEANLNEGHQNKKMMYEVNKNCNDIMVVRQEDYQKKKMLQMIPMMVLDWMSF